MESLDDYFRSEKLDSENTLQCVKCLKYNQAQIYYKVKTLPRILIIHLKRFDDNGKKLNYDVDCPV